MRTLLIAIATLILATTAFTRANLAPTTNPTKTGSGAISGTASKDGEPLAGISVRLMQRSNAPATTDGTPTTQPAHGGKHARANRGGARPNFIAETTTDDKGNFKFANLAAGNYIVVVRERGSNIGGVSRAVVSDDQTATVSISARERQDRGNKKGK